MLYFVLMLFDSGDESSSSSDQEDGNEHIDREVTNRGGAGIVRGRGLGAGGRRQGGGRGRGTRGRERSAVGCGHGRGSGHGDLNEEVGEGGRSYDDQDTPNNLPPFTPNRPPGNHFPRLVLRNAMTTAVEFFKLFFTVELVTNISNYTNSYAYGCVADGNHGSYAQRDGSWLDTSPDEIYRVIAMVLYSGLVKVSNLSRYWSTKTLYHGLWARKIISRERFSAIMAMLHVVDPTTEEEEVNNPNYKLRHVQSFVEYIKGKCTSLYQPRQNVAIDERMVKSRHRSGIRQYVRNKPTKWGIKLWVLADSSNGYTSDFDVYIGKDAGRDVSGHGLGYDVVMKLIRPLLNQGYRLFIDNFYTSMQLLQDLWRQGVAGTGTVSENRRGFPRSLRHSKQWAKGKERGCMRWERTGPCLALQWIDNKVVSMLSTIDNANDVVQVTRKAKTDNVWREVNVVQPVVVQRYNAYMNGVDRSDQMLAYYHCLRKCGKWWKVLFFHLIDIAVVNAFILFKQHQRDNPENEALRRPSSYSLLDFREELVRQLCGLETFAPPPASSRVKPPGEFDLGDHVPSFTDVRRSCKVCSKEGIDSRIYSFCSAPQCHGVYLHLTREKNCFVRWHSRDYQR